MLTLLALITAVGSADADRLSHMTNLNDEVCLRAFPDDKAIEALMTAQHAKPLTADEVRVTMHDDPARGWVLQDGTTTVWIEFPPYHACSVRWNTPEIGDLHEYRAIADRYEAANGTFSPMDPYETDYGDIHVHAVGETRTLPDGGAESLFIFDQQLNAAKRRAAGETGYSLRFVHQFHGPEAK